MLTEKGLKLENSATKLSKDIKQKVQEACNLRKQVALFSQHESVGLNE